jgi:O-antigen/teichoic acid export membrane protein
MLGRSVLLNVVVQLWQSVCGYAIALVLARALGPVAYGVYGVVYSVLLTAELIARLGVPIAVNRLVAAEPARAPAITATAVTATLVITSVLWIGFVIAAPVLADLLALPGGAGLLRLAALDIPIFGLFLVLTGALQGAHRFTAASAATAVYAGAKLAGIALLIPFGPSAAGALLVNVAGSAVALLFCLWALGIGVLRPRLVEGRAILNLAAPVALRGVAVQLLSALDLWALGIAGAMVAPAERGFYVAAVSIARLPNIVVLGSTGMLIATLTRALADGDTQRARTILETALRWLLALLVPATILLAANAREIMALLFGDDYAGGGRFLALLVFGHGLAAPLLTVLTGALIAAAQPGAAARSGLAALVLLVVLLGVLVPVMGATGAAAASLAATSVAAILAGVTVHRCFGAWLRIGTLLRITLSAGVIGGVSWRLPSTGAMLLLELAGLGALSFAALLPLGVLRRGELMSLIRRA